jgi:N-acetylglucosaminyl-diphospho-decaprenol L-rhamnosyltransferase
MTITAIVPVWNGREVLGKLLRSLEAQTVPATELLVVDNGSSDGAPELARERGARVIPMGRNAGFAAAVNRGIRESHSEWIAILNSDVELAPDYFALLSMSSAWFATGKILSGPKSATDDETAFIDGTFDAVCRGGTAWRVGSGRSDGPLFDVRQEVTSPPWTAVLFRAELFARVGLLEESFESYLEDVDFGLRCAARGLTGYYVPAALAWHLGSATLGRWHPNTVRRISRNQLLLLARHYPTALLWRCLWPIAVAQILWGALAIRHGAGVAWLRGKFAGVMKFSRARTAGGVVGSELLQYLRANEASIWNVQRTTGFDWYWRVYFRLTGGGAK